MTDEVIQQEQEDDAAFEQGFAEARGEESPTTESHEEPVSQEESQETEEAQEAQEEPQEEQLYAGLTESQLKAQLARVAELDEMKQQVRQAFGKIGELNAKLQQAQTAKATLSPGQLKRLASEFPEMAALLEEDLGSLSVGGNQFDPSPLVNELHATKQQFEEAKQEQEKKLLSIAHRDWQTVVASDDFTLWKQTLPSEERQTLDTSWDALYIADKISEFKEWRGKAQTSKQQKTKRLEAAVTPQGITKAGPSAINDDDAFLAGFKAVRG